MTNILIVEDDYGLSNGIVLTLKGEDRNFTQCFDLASAREELYNKDYELILLDINFPDGSGLDFCKEIRKNLTVPIIFLTANDTEIDMVSGLEAGGDDYITKPFSLAVLRARVNAVLRRRSNYIKQNKFEIDNFKFVFETMEFKNHNIPIELSKTEQKLLYLLVQNRGQVMSREILLKKVWSDGTEYVDENALSVAIRRLRSKLEKDPSSPKYILTVFGIGYTWAVK